MKRHAGVWRLLGSLGCGLLVVVAGTGCGGDQSSDEQGGLRVMASTGYLADIAQNVAGTRLHVMTLIPDETDPHSFEPTPHDVKRLAESPLLILDAVGLAPLLDELVVGAGRPGQIVVEAAEGLTGRMTEEKGAHDDGQAPGFEADPHFWLDPIAVTGYVDNIRRSFSAIDPEGTETYEANAESYGEQLRELDAWIAAQVESIPVQRRLLVTNHESLGYFADRYGFRIVGSVFPTVTGEGTPSARQLAALTEEIEATGAPAIFLETGSNADLARQIASEAGVEVVTDLYTHSLGENAPTYLDMMRWNVDLIVGALR